MTTHALMWWPADRQGTVVSLNLIKIPRKELSEYHVGEEVQAQCPGYPGLHRAIVYSIGQKKDLYILSKDPNFLEKALVMQEEVEPKPKEVTRVCDTDQPKPAQGQKPTKKTPVNVPVVADMAQRIAEKTNGNGDAEQPQTSSTERSRPKDDFVTRKEFKEMEEEVRKLKAQIKRIRRQSNPAEHGSSLPSPSLPTLEVASPLPKSPSPKSPSPTSPSPKSPSPKSPSPSPSEEALHELIRHEDKPFLAVKIVLCQLFPRAYILSHSVSGKASNSKTIAKPPFDLRLFGRMLSVVTGKFPQLKRSMITPLVHAVQKCLTKSTA